MKISDVTTADLEDVWRLNEDSVPHVSSVDLTEMQWFANHAHYFRVAMRDEQLAGFLIGLRPGLPYGSLNYRWFSENYRDFGYVDRVAVSQSARRLGVATRLYRDFASTLDKSVGVMTCEVNIRPANESSMRYHEQHGFVQVGTQETEGGKKEVALMEMKL
ncbi:MAG: GNAT family N-acetyltransferase [Woeseiaceae bacterium]